MPLVEFVPPNKFIYHLPPTNHDHFLKITRLHHKLFVIGGSIIFTFVWVCTMLSVLSFVYKSPETAQFALAMILWATVAFGATIVPLALYYGFKAVWTLE